MTIGGGKKQREENCHSSLGVLWHGAVRGICVRLVDKGQRERNRRTEQQPVLAQLPRGSVGSYTTLNADAAGTYSDIPVQFHGDGTYKKYWGPGAAGTASEFLNYGFKARYELKEKNRFDREYVETSWRQQSTALALLNDLGVSSPVKAFSIADGSGGIDRSITAMTQCLCSQRRLARVRAVQWRHAIYGYSCARIWRRSLQFA